MYRKPEPDERWWTEGKTGCGFGPEDCPPDLPELPILPKMRPTLLANKSSDLNDPAIPEAAELDC